MWADSHCHLDDERYGGLSVQDIVTRAKESQVTRLITIGTDIKSCNKVTRIASEFDNVYCTIGVHPHESDKVKLADVEAALAEYVKAPKVVGIGEIGLDYFKNISSVGTQRKLFELQLGIAARHGRPVVVHCRDAHDDCVSILKEYRLARVVLHCYTGTVEEARRYLDMGYYISFSGILTFKKAGELHKVAAYVPADRMLIETDSPYLAPEPYRGKVNEPAYVVKVAEKLAELRNTSTASLAESLSSNLDNVFSL